MKRIRLSSESGVTMPLVAIVLVALMGFCALVIDLGNGWMVRRSLIQSTDSAALAAAQDFVNGVDGCSSGMANSYVVANQGTITQCDPFLYSGGEQGRVTVSASNNVNTWFSSMVGAGDYTANSTTTAVWGPPIAVTGLRPIGICFGGSFALQAIVNNPPTSDVSLLVPYDKDQPDACADDSAFPGNWGVIDFDGGGNTFKDMVENGYNGPVGYQNHVVSSCTAEPHCHPVDPGTPTGAQNELNTLKNSGIFFTLPVINFAEGSGSGPATLAHIMAFVKVRLDDFRVTGPPSNRFFLFTVSPGLVTGPCCGPGNGSGGNKVIAICGVDPSATSNCDP